MNAAAINRENMLTPPSNSVLAVAGPGPVAVAGDGIDILILQYFLILQYVNTLIITKINNILAYLY